MCHVGLNGSSTRSGQACSAKPQARMDDPAAGFGRLINAIDALDKECCPRTTDCVILGCKIVVLCSKYC